MSELPEGLGGRGAERSCETSARRICHPDAAFQGRSLAVYQRPLPVGLVTFELNPPDRTSPLSDVSMPDLPNLS
jgi:hypothetical protein